MHARSIIAISVAALLAARNTAITVNVRPGVELSTKQLRDVLNRR